VPSFRIAEDPYASIIVLKIRGILLFQLMDKIFQILAVFALMMLIVRRFIKGREPRFHPYDYINRIKRPLPPVVAERLVSAVFRPAEEGGMSLQGGGEFEDRGRYPVEGGVDAFLLYAAGGLVFCYSAVGRLTIFRQTPLRQVQELAVPLDCTAIAFDPDDERLYFETGGSLFVYGPV
jgi:hypothetical protein